MRITELPLGTQTINDFVAGDSTTDGTRKISIPVDYGRRENAIADNANLNNITTIGRYYNVNPTNITNLPTPCVSIDLWVFARGYNDRVWQMAYCYHNAGSVVYIRSMTGANTWARWEKLTPELAALATPVSNANDAGVPGVSRKPRYAPHPLP